MAITSNYVTEQQLNEFILEHMDYIADRLPKGIDFDFSNIKIRSEFNMNYYRTFIHFDIKEQNTDAWFGITIPLDSKF